MKKILVVSALFMASLMVSSQAMAAAQNLAMVVEMGPTTVVDAASGYTTIYESGELYKGTPAVDVGTYYFERKFPTDAGWFMNESGSAKTAFATVYVNMKDAASSIVASGAYNMRSNYFAAQIGSVFNPSAAQYGYLVNGTVQIQPGTPNKNLRLEWADTTPARSFP